VSDVWSAIFRKIGLGLGASVLLLRARAVCDNLLEELIMEAYCFKCRTKREVSNPEAVTLKNGRPATQGTCGVCKTKLFRIGRA